MVKLNDKRKVLNMKGALDMFSTESRYITCGIKEKLHEELQRFVWMSVDLQNAFYEDEMDYLQVFTFRKIGEDILAITQSQEKPSKEITHFTLYKPEYEMILDKKVYVIDDGEHSTMLFAEEY